MHGLNCMIKYFQKTTNPLDDYDKNNIKNTCIPAYSNCNLEFKWKEIKFTS